MVAMGCTRTVAALVTFLAATAHAGVVKTWSIAELQQAPVLAVCSVEDVAKLEPVPADAPQNLRPSSWHEATLRVERVHSTLAIAPAPGDRIVVRYISFDGAGGIGFGGPVWAKFEKGERVVFALRRSNERPDRWSLFAEEGFNTTVPAIEEEWRRTDAPATPREFILAELINGLANGSPAEQYAASNYISRGFVLPPEAQQLLDTALGDREERWLGVAASLAAALGIPRPSLAEIMSGSYVKDQIRGPVLGLLGHALEMGAKRDFPDRVIVKLVDDAPIHDWGSATTLTEFRDSPVLAERLGAALRSNQYGAMTIAWHLARSGTVLPQALETAQKFVTNPGSVNMTELQAASGLIRDYGSDAQFGSLVATLRRLKTSDVEQYQKLWGSASYSENKREIELAAVLIDDTRVEFSSIRYCDVAAERLQRLSGRDFGVGQAMTRADWDRVVSKARGWLANRVR